MLPCAGGEIEQDRVGFVAETENYRFCLRCTTMNGDYGYIYCYDLNQQRLAMEQGSVPQQYGFSSDRTIIEALEQIHQTFDVPEQSMKMGGMG